MSKIQDLNGDSQYADFYDPDGNSWTLQGNPELVARTRRQAQSHCFNRCR